MEENTKVENTQNFANNDETQQNQASQTKQEPTKDQKVPERDEEIKNPEFKYKLLTEKKKLQQERDELMQKLKERETQELEQQAKYKELYESVRQENERLKTTMTESQQREENNKKLAYLTKELKKQGAKEERLEFLLKNADVSSIKYDDEHGVFYGHEEEAAKLKQTLPEVFARGNQQVDQTSTDFKTEGSEYKTFRDIPIEKRRDRKFMQSWYESQGISVRK